MVDLTEGDGLDNCQVFLISGMGKEISICPESNHGPTQHPSYGDRGTFPREEKWPWSEPNHYSFYSITPLIRIKWDGQPSDYAQNTDNLIFL